jgi:hypothetical protein
MEKGEEGTFGMQIEMKTWSAGKPPLGVANR